MPMYHDNPRRAEPSRPRVPSPILLTRHYSGFDNVADRWSLGNHEADGDAVCGCYELPAGYRLDWLNTRPRILDPKGFEVAIVTHRSGNPVLVSRGGPVTTQPVLREIPKGR